ncbi:hypothetical protein Bra3105_18000 [Brachybacterium halotolerans subsp. kimchii]|uniref:hypothetical protein n=1 Tax=Brachybacterium halotolerans TaxID=2795215 RepID=UPI001E2A963E|nr:hypothetical protein [Brachybacterium halotolerans]UEJ82694.1 hypothetical protein Bra3105_18000 [Brachybacterium halotolerans subsp. kimchii]
MEIREDRPSVSVATIARGDAGPRAVGVVLLVIMLGCAALVLWPVRSATTADILVAAACALGGILLAGMLWRLRLRATVDQGGLRLQGGILFGRARRIPRSAIRAARSGYHLAGMGFGWGRRHEGPRDIALRAGGPMVTILLEDGRRLAFSTPEPEALVRALSAPSDDVDRDR